MNNIFDINIARKQLNITAEQMANDINISYFKMSAIIHNKIPISDEVVGRMFRVYGKDIFLSQN